MSKPSSGFEPEESPLGDATAELLEAGGEEAWAIDRSTMAVELAGMVAALDEKDEAGSGDRPGQGRSTASAAAVAAMSMDSDEDEDEDGAEEDLSEVLGVDRADGVLMPPVFLAPSASDGEAILRMLADPNIRSPEADGHGLAGLERRCAATMLPLPEGRVLRCSCCRADVHAGAWGAS